MSEQRKIYLTDADLAKLEDLLRVYGSTTHGQALEEELSLAKVVSSELIPPDVVTMNSKVRFKDEVTGKESEITLVYPNNSDANEGRISVLTPVGTALLGLSVGQVVDWPMPTGKMRRLKITSVLYQPEAEGRFDL